MAVTIFKVFSPGEILTASDLNNSLLQVFDNGQDIGSPRTKAFDMDGQKLILDADQNTSITASTDDQVDIEIGGNDIVVITPTDMKFNGVSLLPSHWVKRLNIGGMAFQISTVGHRVSELEAKSVLESQVFA